jgi:predicted ATPase
MARLDRLPEVRDVAQLGAVIGRCFDYKLLAAVVGRDEERLTADLVNLEKTGVLIRRGVPPDSNYTFAHALIQDAAYGSLLRARRQDYHRRVAEALEKLLPGTVEADPALLAHHYTQAGVPDSAIRYLRQAGTHAVEAGANAEAVDNFAKALDLLARVPESRERAREEIDICLGLGVAKVQEMGSSSAEDTYVRALKLSERWGTPQQKFAASWGMWYVHFQRGEEHRAREFGDALLPLAQTLKDTALILEAHHVQWGTLTLIGDFNSALAHSKEGISLYEPERHHWLTFVYGGHDPGGCAYGVNAVILCLLGYPERARRQCAAALDLAHKLNHPYSVADVLFSILIVALLTRDLDEIERHIGALDELQPRLPLVDWGLNSAYKGWLLTEHGFLEQGLDLMRGAEWRARWGPWCYPLDASLAFLLGRMGHRDEALGLIDHCLNAAATGDAHWWDAEFYRVRAGLHGSSDSDGRREAEADLEKAVADARNRGARFLELRAATELARLWAIGGESRRAHELLTPIYGWFTEGFETADLKDAKALLDELSM